MSSQSVRRTLRATAAAAVLALVLLLGVQWTDHSGGPDIPHAKRVGRARDLLEDGCHGRDVVIELQLRRLDLREDTITVAPTLCIPDATLLDFAAPLHPDDVFGPSVSVMRPDGGPMGSPAVRPRYENVGIRLLVFDGDPGVAHERDMPLKLLYGSGFDYLNFVGYRVQSVRPFSVTLDGKDEDYPFDVYSTDIAATAYVYGAVRRSAISRGDPFEIPARVEPAVDADLRGYRVVDGHGSDPSDFTIRVSRARETQEYVLALLLIPLLLIAVLARARQGRRGGSENIVGAAAVMLALLPIRAVLVPSDIGSLTLVDSALGVEVALLALVVIWRETAR